MYKLNEKKNALLDERYQTNNSAIITLTPLRKKTNQKILQIILNILT